MNKPNILAVIEKEGIQLKQRGENIWSQCPFHEDKTPSLKVDPNKQVFYCFGCGAGGDVITFIEKLKGYSFKDSLVYLGISNGKPSKIYKVQTIERNLIKGFDQWCHEYYCKLCEVLLALDKRKMKAKGFEDINFLAEFYHKEPTWNYYADVLFNGSDDEKYQLYCEVKDGN